jgi:hypothetical protein
VNKTAINHEVTSIINKSEWLDSRGQFLGQCLISTWKRPNQVFTQNQAEPRIFVYRTEPKFLAYIITSKKMTYDTARRSQKILKIFCVELEMLNSNFVMEINFRGHFLIL